MSSSGRGATTLKRRDTTYTLTVDQRLVVTVPFITHLVCGAMLALAYSMASVQFTQGQLEFLVIVGYVTPLAAMGLIWVKNYVYGAPLLFGSAIANCWFSVYFFLVHENPVNVFWVSGDGASAYTAAVVAVVMGSLLTAGTGVWLWYRESDGFRSTVDGIVRPPDSRE